MGRPSSIKRLPPDIRERLDEWIRDEGVTQTEAAERVNELLAELYPDHPPVSRVAVHRYDRSMQEIGEHIQETRQLADAWIAKLGSTPGGKTGLLMIEILRGVAFDLSRKMAMSELTDESMPGLVNGLNKLALTAQRLERSAEISVRREKQVREEESRKTAEGIVAGAAKEPGGRVSAERLREIARDVYGIRQKGISAETANAIKSQILGIDPEDSAGPAPA